MQRSKVLLQAPLGPMIAIFSPIATSTLTPRKAPGSPYRFGPVDTRPQDGVERSSTWATGVQLAMRASDKPGDAVPFVGRILDVARGDAVSDGAHVETRLTQRRQHRVVRDWRGHDHDLVEPFDSAFALIVVVEERDDAVPYVAKIMMRR